MKRWANNKNHGFTIVELLIVIVVIGILAAITIVAFNGIQTRTENNKTVSAVGGWVKALRQYAVQNDSGLFPIETTYPCMGEAPTISRCANTQDSTSPCFGAGGATPRPTFVTTMKTVVSKIPELSTQSMDCGGRQYGGGFYNSVNGSTATLTFYLKGSMSSCPAIAGITPSSQTRDDTTVCTIILNAS